MSSFTVSGRFVTSLIKCAFAVAVVFSTISVVRAETTAKPPVFNSEPSSAQLIELAKKQATQDKANKSTTTQPSAAKKTETTKATEPKVVEPKTVEKKAAEPKVAQEKAAEPKVTEKKETTKTEATPKANTEKTAQSQTVQKPVIDPKILPTEKKPVAKKDALTKFESEIIALTNSHRAQNGMPPLAVDMNLMSTARAHCNWMASSNSMQHGSYPVAENIAMGQNSAHEALNTWMNSSGHRANILSGRGSIGVAAYVSSSGQIFWCQQFR